MVKQSTYFSDQDIFDLDIDDLYNSLIVPIDQIRSHNNAIDPSNNAIYSIDYQESRCHAFLRMTGFPVSDTSGNFYSPGYDPNLNMNAAAQSANATIAQNIISNTSFVANQLNVRENNVWKFYRPFFLNGGINSISLGLGSVFIRALDKQFVEGQGPFDLDPGQVQSVKAREDYLRTFYSDKISSINNGAIANLVQSRHYLKPFIVDPRIASAIVPQRNTICAPFLLDKTQTKIIDGPNTSSVYLKRPYIERILTTRLSNTVNSGNSNTPQTSGQEYITTIAEQLANNSTITNDDLVTLIADQNQYFTSEQLIFDRYFRIMRAMLTTLSRSINQIGYTRENINWQPTPNSSLGPENGATLNDFDASDTLRNQNNNTRKINYELDIGNMQTKSAIDKAQFDLGLNNTVDLGDFTFSNIDDSVFSAFKSSTKSYDDNITALTNNRNSIGNAGIAAMRNVELIMGEFSGIGMIDILAIQAALWIVPISSLLGLIDDRAFARIPKNLLNSSITRNGSVISSLTDFESNLITIYKLLQTYLNNLQSGNAVLNNTSS